MTIPKSYEALAADLASEKILSKTLLGQKEAYMTLADKGGLDLSESKAREAALREELEESEEENSNLREVIRDIKNWRDVSQSSSALSSLLKQADEIKNKPSPLQQRLTVAEQRAEDLKKLLCDVINEAPTGFAALKVDLANRVNDALKPAAEG